MRLLQVWVLGLKAFSSGDALHGTFGVPSDTPVPAPSLPEGIGILCPKMSAAVASGEGKPRNARNR